MMMKNETPEDGLHTEYEYFDNGQIKEERNYKDGEYDGKLTEWNENGEITSVSIWKDGECVSGNW